MPNEMNNYIEDDWNDNKLKNRDNPEKGIYYSYNDSGTGDLLKGVYRPVWGTEAPGSTSVYAENGRLYQEGNGDSSNSYARTPCKLTVGEVTFDWALYQYDSYTGRQAYPISFGGFSFEADFGDEGSRPRYELKGSWGMSTASANPDTNEHSTRITFDSYGNYELYVDGASKITQVGDTPSPDFVNIRRYHDSVEHYTSNIALK